MAGRHPVIGEYPQWLQQASGAWGDVKLFAEQSGIDNDLMHVLAGPVVHGLAALVLRQSVQRMAPWLVVFVLELLNEWHDLVSETWPIRTMQYGEGLKDILLTMLLPTVVLLLTRNYPHWFGMKSPRRARRG